MSIIFFICIFYYALSTMFLLGRLINKFPTISDILFTIVFGFIMFPILLGYLTTIEDTEL